MKNYTEFLEHFLGVDQVLSTDKCLMLYEAYKLGYRDGIK